MKSNPASDPDEQSDNDASEAFVGLLLQHRHTLYAFIAKQLVNPADVEDIYQKTSIVLWKKMGSFDRNGSFFHWACGIAFNEIRNFLTVQRRSKLCFDPDLVDLLAQEAAEECELSQARLDALHICMNLLSERQQTILRRCYLGTDTISEIADMLGRERGALYKQLARLKEKLIDCMTRQLIAEGVGQ